MRILLRYLSYTTRTESICTAGPASRYNNIKIYCLSGAGAVSPLRAVSGDRTTVHLGIAVAWQLGVESIFIVNQCQSFWALMLNGDQIPLAADEIWFQLVSKPAESFNHKVNQGLEHKSDEQYRPCRTSLATDPAQEISVIFQTYSRLKAAFGERFLSGSWSAPRAAASSPATAGSWPAEHVVIVCPMNLILCD